MTDFVEDNCDLPAFLDRRGDDAPSKGGWRDHLKIHPACDLFPRMSESELRELGEDIKANGLRASIVLYRDKLLDGRNRLDAMELVGIKFGFMAEQTRPTKNKFCYLHACDGSDIFDSQAGGIDHFDGDPYNFVLSANLHRRHLTADQKRDLITKVLKAKPEASNNQIAKQTKTSDKTVAKVRGKLESGSEIPKLEKTTGGDGKEYPVRKTIKKPEPAITESAEVDIERRRAENAALDDPDGLMSAVDNANTFAALFSGMMRDYPPSQKRMATLLKPVEEATSAWFRIKADLEMKLHADKKTAA
jgi:hypothetical protein